MRAHDGSLRLGRAAAAAVFVLATSLAACSSSDGSQAVRTTTVRTLATVSSPTTVSSGPIWAMPGSATLPSGDALQAALDSWIAFGHLSGVTAAVVTLNGTWSGAAGVDAAGTAIRPESALSTMSVSKTYTAAEVLAPATRGQLDLDAPVSTYVDRPFDTHGATVRQLVAMRSGFPTTDVGNDQTRMAADLGRTWTTREWLAAIPTDAGGSARWAASPATTASTTARAELRSDQAARRLSLIRNRPPPTAPSPSNSEIHGASPPVAGS